MDLNNAISSWVSQGPSSAHACNCIGPQNGDPVCPCQMRGVVEVDGRYVRITDLGPVISKISLPEPETPEERVNRLRKELEEAEKAIDPISTEDGCIVDNS